MSIIHLGNKIGLTRDPRIGTIDIFCQRYRPFLVCILEVEPKLSSHIGNLILTSNFWRFGGTEFSYVSVNCQNAPSEYEADKKPEISKNYHYHLF